MIVYKYHIAERVIVPVKNIKPRDLEATPVGRATSKLASDVVCLLLLVYRRLRIAMTLSAKI